MRRHISVPGATCKEQFRATRKYVRADIQRETNLQNTSSDSAKLAARTIQKVR